jgi:hypothetical protein
MYWGIFNSPDIIPTIARAAEFLEITNSELRKLCEEDKIQQEPRKGGVFIFKKQVLIKFKKENQLGKGNHIPSSKSKNIVSHKLLQFFVSIFKL